MVAVSLKKEFFINYQYKQRNYQRDDRIESERESGPTTNKVKKFDDEKVFDEHFRIVILAER